MGRPIMDVLTCGELLIDFVAMEAGATLAQAELFHKAPGGAPANVAVGVARLGHRSGFLGQVGDDEFGHFLAETLRSNGVDVSGLRFSTQARTALAFVARDTQGEHAFLFYKQGSADTLWRAEDVDPAYVGNTRIFHYGSISLIHEPSRHATMAALEYAKNSGAVLSYDPNLRLSLWPSPQAARAGIMAGWQHAEVIKVTEEEVRFLSGEQILERAVRSLWQKSLRLLVVTHGKAGCSYFTEESSGQVPGFLIQAQDTTGAGDAFVSGMLSGLLTAGLIWEKDTIEEALAFGNAAGALSTTQIGAMSSFPSREMVEKLLRQA